MFFTRNNEVAEKASKFWTDNLQRPYTVVYRGNIGFKLEREPVLSENQAMLFRSRLTSEITKGLRKNGYLQIKRSDAIIGKALSEVGAGNSDDNTGEVMFIEDDSEIYFYAPGMKRAKKL